MALRNRPDPHPDPDRATAMAAALNELILAHCTGPDGYFTRAGILESLQALATAFGSVLESLPDDAETTAILYFNAQLVHWRLKLRKAGSHHRRR